MSQRESLEVRMDDRLVGTLALTANHKVAFSYSEEWLEHGFSVSPFSLPLKNEVFVPKKIILTDCSEYLQIVYRMHGDSFIGAFAERTWKKGSTIFGIGSSCHRGKIWNGSFDLSSAEGDWDGTTDG